ncbi:hypothetical protein [Enterobacter asburiae]|uniref:hypothetical protein n=1 Tax=Enterobacter asburiae TaxID=61645 RepID=UPI00192AB6C9|nr:hypothetical protein [Enterobacter asburiae]MBL5927807.1 hypothetical protein [Enterobacter asburiae]MBL5958594.1 hypothetical protein [Enterobacter asburiae]
MSSEFLIYENRIGSKLYLTELDDENNPLSGIGFQSSSDGTVPLAAGSCPTRKDAMKVIAYLREAIGDGSEDYQIEERAAQ